jgi:hypothetical protein
VFCFWRELFPGPCGLWLNIFGANFQNAKKSTQQPNTPTTDDRATKTTTFPMHINTGLQVHKSIHTTLIVKHCLFLSADHVATR